MSALADERHGPEVYLATMKFLLSGMVVDEPTLVAHVSHYRETKRMQKHAWAVKYVEASKHRPSMRDVARRVSGGMAVVGYDDPAAGEGRAVQGGCAYTSASLGGVGATTFDLFCDAVRFPVSTSKLLRHRCYLLCAQAHVFDFARHTERIAPSDVAASLSRNAITFPDVESLCTAIETLAMNIAPFPEINVFRQRAFVSFAINQRRGLTLTQAGGPRPRPPSPLGNKTNASAAQVLHLYVAAYQRQWRLCWKRIYPILSAQIARDVEAFVASTPFAHEPFLVILKTSTPFVE